MTPSEQSASATAATDDMSAVTLANLSFTDSLDNYHLSLHSRSMMLNLSYLIEDYATSETDTLLIAAFQRFSFYRHQLVRYRRLAPRCRHVYVLGMPDEKPPEVANVTYIPIEATWPLMHEWAVIANGPTCCIALCARDHQQLQPARRAEHFQALWTTSVPLIDHAVTSFFIAIGQSPPVIDRDPQVLNQAIAAPRLPVGVRRRRARYGCHVVEGQIE